MGTASSTTSFPGQAMKLRELSRSFAVTIAPTHSAAAVAVDRMNVDAANSTMRATKALVVCLLPGKDSLTLL